MAYKRISAQPVIEGGTGRTINTAYSVFCGGTAPTTQFQNVSGFGSAGNVLTSAGAGALPTWQAPTGGTGAWTLLQTQNPSGVGSVAFTTGFSSTYRNYALLISNMTFTVVSGVPAVNMTFSTNGGSSYLSTGYIAGLNTIRDLVLTWTNTNSTSVAPLFAALASPFSSTEGNYQGIIYISGPGYAMNTKWYGNSGYSDVFLAAPRLFQGAFGGIIAASMVNALSIQTSSGTFSGAFSLYGIDQ